MDLLCITDASKKFDVSSKTLRYYENVGILKSTRMKDNKYRYYDDEAVERIKQILILRKMQISIKDIIRIYENEDMSTIVEVFVDRINAIDEQVGALSELKNIINEFLQAMLKKGITKISALPLLYEEMDKQLTVSEEHKPITYEELSAVSEKLRKEIDISILELPNMRILSSKRKDNGQSDIEGFTDWLVLNNIPRNLPGNHESFEYQEAENETVIICKINDGFENDSPFVDSAFGGGLFIAASVYLDETLGERFRALIKDFDDNKYYQIDYRSDGSLRHPAMLENLISPDNQRELVALLVPVKKRMADPALFDKPEEITNVSIAEIETQNPVLWTKNVAMDKLIPLNGPHYRVTEQGEAEYISWITMRSLSTNVAVTVPFRVDIEFRIGEESGGYGHGCNEGSIRFHHGEDYNLLFGINMNNNPDERLSKEAICFHQPIFGDYYQYPKRGRINPDEYNRLTWIVGMKHFAVIINDEIRYCGVDFPYMAADLTLHQARPIIVSSDSSLKRYFKSIQISQLVHQPKIRIKEGALTMVTKKSNNMISNIRQFIGSEDGQNYHFNGGAAYVMECLGEPDYTYEFFAGLTGDVFAQIYAYGVFRGDGVTDYMIGNFSNDDLQGDFVEHIFSICGYDSSVVFKKELQKNSEMYLQTLLSYIDKGVPVIEFGYGTAGPPWGVFVGYEEYGKTLLYMTHNNKEPERVPLDKGLSANWIFIGQKKESYELKQLYREAITNLPKLLTTKTAQYCFGAEAFNAWADDIENGKFEGIKPENFDSWFMHTSYICCLATNGSCCYGFLKQAQELNPDMGFLENIINLYKRTGEIWNNDNGQDLEALGGGFNVTLEALQDREKRSKIAAKIRECGDCIDEIVRIIKDNLQK